jgi:hypothetical protein
MNEQCQQISTLLWRRIDRETLSQSDEQRLEGHLDSCAQCHADVALFESEDAVIAAAFSDLQDVDSLNDQIFSALASERKQPSLTIKPSIDFTGGLWRFAPVAAAAIILAWLLIGAPDKPMTAAQKSNFVAFAAVKNHGLLVKRDGVWKKLKSGSDIGRGEIIQNRSQSPSTIEFSNKTQVTLRGDSTAKISKAHDGATEIDLTAGGGGEILCTVTPGYGQFRVIAHDMRVTVIGTKFLVRSFQGLTRVVVLEGKVRCQSSASQAFLSPRQEAEVGSNERIVVNESNLKKRTHWLDKKSAPARPSKPEPESEPKPVNKPEPGPEKANPPRPDPRLDLPVAPPKTDSGD